MAVKLNLLPSDYAVSKPVATVLNIVRPLNVILLAIFLTCALGMAGFFIISSVSLNSLSSTNNSLKNQIQAQQVAQQQEVLLKDRLGKIQTVYNYPSGLKNLTSIGSVIGMLPVNSSVTEMELTSEKTSLSVLFTSNSDLTTFVKTLNSQNTFSGISLDSFAYNPANGYMVGVSFVGKK